MAQLVTAIGAETQGEVHAGYRVVLKPAGRRIRAVFRGQTIADSSRVLVMRETRLPSATSARSGAAPSFARPEVWR